ncbi:MAG: hypothetical protein H6686_07250 [Fibrobacteria bacterium]|nr:hypothetical protein [Fibrobacteria bacterium]
MLHRFLSLSAIVVFAFLAGCDSTEVEAKAPVATQEDALALRKNNEALLANIASLKTWAESLRSSPVAGRSLATTPELDLSQMRSQIRVSLEAQGVCPRFIQFVVDLFDLLGEMLESPESMTNDAAWEQRFLEVFRVALSCLEPLMTQAMESGEGMMPLESLQSFDRCLCGEGGGSIFGTSAALVYSSYGAPALGDGYSAPGSAGGSTYGAPGSPAGEGYGAPSQLP